MEHKHQDKALAGKTVRVVVDPTSFAPPEAGIPWSFRKLCGDQPESRSQQHDDETYESAEIASPSERVRLCTILPIQPRGFYDFERSGLPCKTW
jgi:hypothetical protein